MRGVSGTWKDLTDNVNFMASNLTSQVRNIATVTTAVANGDLSKKITVDVQGEILELKITINTMVDQLNSFASEVTRVAREVGTEGKLGGQAEVKGVAGVWKDLTDNVNFMASNLTTQVRGIARVVTAVANGNLNRKLEVEALGEIAELADTINAMIDTLATFADQVTTVAREVGIEGELGGQANVPGASGTWRDLTDNVNQLAANLTNQVRAMADVATAVTKGDLTRSITVDASGEVAFLKDNVNEMIRNLRETTQKNTEQDWLKTNLAKFTRLLQGQRDLLTVARLILSEMAPLVEMQHGVFYIADTVEDETVLKMLASYAYRKRKSVANEFKLGESIVGQCALEKERIIIKNVPPDYVKINSGLGEAAPTNIVVLPVLFEGQVKAVIELASFTPFNEIHFGFLDQLTESIGIVINTIEANMRTEELLKQSQSLAQELQLGQAELQETNRRLELQAQSLQTSEELLKQQQEELQQTNQELEEKATLLSEQKSEVEQKNRQIELARTALEDKAKQLAHSARNTNPSFSRTCRTSCARRSIRCSFFRRCSRKMPKTTLNEKQVEFAETIHSSGADLLALINEILDLSKIESGTMGVEIGEVHFSDFAGDIERTFSQIAKDKGLQLIIDLGEQLAAEYADRRQTPAPGAEKSACRTRSSLRSRDRSKCRDRMSPTSGWSFDNDSLNRASSVIAFTRQRHGHRHSRRQTAADLRSVPAGRRNDEPQIRRNRPRAFDQPRDRTSARRRDHARKHAGRGQHIYVLPAGKLRAGDASIRRTKNSDEDRLRKSVSAAEPDFARSRAAGRRLPSRVQIIVSDDRSQITARRQRAADHRGRRSFRPDPDGYRPRRGLQMSRFAARRGRSDDGAEISARMRSRSI